MTTLSDGTTTVTLPADLVWGDEYTWAPVQQSQTRTITGGLIVQSQARLGGRPITLASSTDDRAWLSRTVLEQLRAWAAVPAQALVLTLRGLAHNVIWRHEDGAIQADAVMDWADVAADDDYRATLRFTEI